MHMNFSSKQLRDLGYFVSLFTFVSLASKKEKETEKETKRNVHTKKRQEMVTPTQSKNTLCFSNLAYLLPAIATLYKLNQNDIQIYDAVGLTTLLLYVGIFASWSYHECRADLTVASKQNRNAISGTTTNVNKCANCPNTTMGWVQHIPGSQEQLNFEMSRFIDHFTAILTIVVVMLQVIPLHDPVRKCFLLITILWLLTFLACGNEMIALVPALLALLLLFVFWFMTWKANRVSRNVSWLFALVLLFGAVFVFKVDDEPYWLKHSLWHILGALSATFLLLQTATCYKDMDLSKVKFPPQMANIFADPITCDIYRTYSGTI